MKLRINGIEEEYQIIQARRGSFSCEPESGLVWFNEFYIAKGTEVGHEGFSDIALSPLCRDDNGDVLEICKDEVPYNEINGDLLCRIVDGYARYQCESMQYAAEYIIFGFLQHDTPFTLKAVEYALEVLPINSLTLQCLIHKFGLQYDE